MLNKENRIKKIDKRTKQKEYRLLSIKSGLFLLCSMFYSLSATAQCAMCRASLESNGNNTQAEAVNDGIVYLMAIPYILVGVIGIFIYKMYFKKK